MSNPTPWFSTAAATLWRQKKCYEFISWLFSCPQPTHCSVFRWNWENPRVVFCDFWFLRLISAPILSPSSHILEVPVLFLSHVHPWESLCQYTVLDIQRPVETGVTHTTRLSFQAVPFPLLWLCGSLLMSPCQLFFLLKGQLQNVQTFKYCYFMCSSK